MNNTTQPHEDSWAEFLPDGTKVSNIEEVLGIPGNTTEDYKPTIYSSEGCESPTNRERLHQKLVTQHLVKYPEELYFGVSPIPYRKNRKKRPSISLTFTPRRRTRETIWSHIVKMIKPHLKTHPNVL